MGNYMDNIYYRLITGNYSAFSTYTLNNIIADN